MAGGFGPPVLTRLTVQQRIEFGILLFRGTVGGLISFVVALFFSPETKGKATEADLSILRMAELP